MNEAQVTGAIERIYRRVLLAIGRGKLTLVNDSGPVQIIQGSLSPLEVRDGVPRLAEFGFTSNPPAGSDFAFLGVAGDRSNMVCIATGHQPSRPKGLAPGESKMYSVDGKFIYISASGGISVFANGEPVVVSGATTVTIDAADEIIANTPLFKCSGDILDNYETNTKTSALMRSEYDAHGHPVVEVQSGGSTIVSGTPTVIE
jgi:phage baseplate assembly protein V